MWSYVQYRRIERQVEAEIKRKSHLASNNTDKDLSAAERCHESSPDGSSTSQLKGNGKTPKEKTKSPNNHDGKITVKMSGDDDPLDPKNWPLLARSKNIFILSLLIFTQAWAGAAESQANSTISKDFHVSPIAESLSTAMFLFGVGSGCLFVGPLSETFGRNPVYLVSTFVYLLFVLGSALTPTFGGQVICRFFVGLFSSATLGINGSSVRDQFRPVKRAFVFPIIAWANVAGTSPSLPSSHPTCHLSLTWLLEYSTSNSPHSRRLSRLQPPSRVALDRIHNPPHFIFRLPYRRSLSPRNLPSNPARLARQTPPALNLKPRLLFRALTNNILPTRPKARYPPSKIPLHRARHLSFWRVFGVVVHPAVQFPVRV